MTDVDQSTDLRELSLNDAFPRPRAGDVGGGVRALVVIACAVTFALVMIGPRVLREQGTAGRDLYNFWFGNGLAIGTAVALALVCLPSSRVARTIRLAVLLPLLHAASMVVVWLAWTELAPRLPAAELVPFVHEHPLSVVLAISAATIGGLGIVVVRRRRRDALHATVMLALVALLALGLWLPIACGIFIPRATLWEWRIDVERVASVRMIAIMLVPPIVIATIYTALAFRRRELLQANTKYVTLALVFGMLFAFLARVKPGEVSMVTYANYVHWMFAFAAVAIASIIALSVTTWWRTRTMRRAPQYTGRISGTYGDVVAGYAVSSWLCGPQPIASAFDVTTAHGAVPIPGGARLLAPLPLATTILRPGEMTAVLRDGDQVGLDGYDGVSSGQPFRDSSAPIPSTDGVTVSPSVVARGGWEQLALVAWRPCVAYLVILAAIGLPALVAHAK